MNLKHPSDPGQVFHLKTWRENYIDEMLNVVGRMISSCLFYTKKRLHVNLDEEDRYLDSFT